jgi:hypothetical protein
MSGFFARLFGGRNGEAIAAEEPGPQSSTKGFRIRPAPFRAADGEFQTAGVIEKDFADGPKDYRFIRAEKQREFRSGIGVRHRQGAADHRRTRRPDLRPAVR